MKNQDVDGRQAPAGRANLLDLLQDKQLTAKEIARDLDLPIRSIYRYLGALALEGSILKLEKLENGKPVSIYSLPTIAPGVCNWQAHCEMLLAGRTYSKAVLENDFWKPFLQDLRNLASRQENRHIGISGLTGWGKSCTAIWLAKRLDPSFNARDVIFLKEDLLRLVATQPRNKTFVLDDIGVMLDSREWQERERALIFNFLSICRVNGVSTIGTTPSLPMIDINYQRLLHYVLVVELKCRDHLHVLVFKPTTAGLKPSFQPIGTLFLPYPQEVHSIIQDYERLKQKELGLSARESLAKLQKAEESVKQYVLNNDIPRVSEDHLQAALSLSGFDGTVSKTDKIKLRRVMFVALQEKQRLRKQQREVRTDVGKTTLKISKEQSTFSKKYQGFLDAGRSERFAMTLARRLADKMINTDNLASLPPIFKKLIKNVPPRLVENYVLSHLSSRRLVVDLTTLNEIMEKFKNFPEDFVEKLWNMMLSDGAKATIFIKEAWALRDSIFYRDKKGKLSEKKWISGILTRLNLHEAAEKRRWAYEHRFDKLEDAAGKFLGNLGNLFGK